MLGSFGIERSSWRWIRTRVGTDVPFAFLVILFFFLPLLRVGQLEDSFLTPKVVLAQWVLLPALLALVLRMLREPRTTVPLPTSSLFLLGFVALNALSLGHARSAALGLLALAYLLTFYVLHFVALASVKSSRDGWLLVSVGIGAATLTAGWTLLEDATHGELFGRISPRLPDWRGYLAAGLGNSGHIAGFVGMFYPAALIAFLASRRTRWILLGGIALMTASVIVTWSVGSTGSMLVALLFCAAVALGSPHCRLFHWRRLAWVGAVACAELAFYFLPVPGNPHAPSLVLEAFGSQRWAEGWPTRVAIWKTTWHMIAQHPWWGIGCGNFTLEFVRQIVPSLLADPHLRVYAGAFTNEAHNEYLQVWAEGGAFALLVYAGIFVSFFGRTHRLFATLEKPGDRLLVLAAAAGVLVFALDSLMSFPLRLPSHVAVLVVFLALPEAAFARAGATGHAHVSLRFLARPAALALASALFLLLCVSAVLYGRRACAEFYFKQGRTLAEAPVRTPSSTIVSPWSAAENMFESAIEALVRGDRHKAERMLGAVREILAHEPFLLVEHYWRRASSWDPRYSNVSSRYGALLLMRGNYADAVRVLNQALLDLEAVEVHERLGLAHYFLGDPVKAIAQWDLCRQRRPFLAERYRGLIRMAERRGE